MKARTQLAKIAGVALLIATQAQAQPLRQCVEAQRQMTPTVPEGYIWFGYKAYPWPPEAGVRKLPADYRLCPPDRPPLNSKHYTEGEMRAAVRCCDGSKLTEGCTAGTIMFMCNVKTGARIELVSPTKAQIEEWTSAGLMVPFGTITKPHFKASE